LTPTFQKAVAILLILFGASLTGCGKQASQKQVQSPTEGQQQEAPPTLNLTPDGKPQGPPTAEVKRVEGGPPASMFNLSAHPGATVLKALDPHKMSQSEIQFGVAPKRSSEVEYVKDVIIMEEGDKAIRSVAGDGMTWKFDANASHVSEFQEGKVVFATGRAVGKILNLKKEGDTVSVILGPVQLTDVIQNGSFAMSQAIDPNNMVSYVAPDFPQPPEAKPDQKTSSIGSPDDDQVQETIVVNAISQNGEWTPTSMAQTFGDGRRITYRKYGSKWGDAHVSLANLSPSKMVSGYELIPLKAPAQQVTPGIPQLPGGLQIPHVDLPPAHTTGPPPNVDISDVRTKIVADNSGVGLQYYYSKNGLSASAYGIMSIHDAKLDFYLTIKNAKIITCGVGMAGAAGIKLHLDSHSTQEFNVNLHVKHTIPIDVSIPLGGGPVPFALTFSTMFSAESGFSAKQSVLNAEGNYGFGGGVWAGYNMGQWYATTPTKISAMTDLGKSVEGISVGINSFVMSFSLRALVGIGAFGFNTGVYVGLRFTGTALIAPTTAWPCKQGTIEAMLDTGVGYSLPGWVTDAINFFLKPLTGHEIESAGSLLKMPSFGLFHGNTQVPGGCATSKSGGG
jgi:hypothetical protein